MKLDNFAHYTWHYVTADYWTTHSTGLNATSAFTWWEEQSSKACKSFCSSSKKQLLSHTIVCVFCIRLIATLYGLYCISQLQVQKQMTKYCTISEHNRDKEQNSIFYQRKKHKNTLTTAGLPRAWLWYEFQKYYIQLICFFLNNINSFLYDIYCTYCANESIMGSMMTRSTLSVLYKTFQWFVLWAFEPAR